MCHQGHYTYHSLGGMPPPMEPCKVSLNPHPHPICTQQSLHPRLLNQSVSSCQLLTTRLASAECMAEQSVRSLLHPIACPSVFITVNMVDWKQCSQEGCRTSRACRQTATRCMVFPQTAKCVQCGEESKDMYCCPAALLLVAVIRYIVCIDASLFWYAPHRS